ncbi:hypothetical protein [Clostridium botulinum]|nr:hypothetical protein [Clostridium botulinum]
MKTISVFEKQLELGTDPDKLYLINSNKLKTNKIISYYKIDLNGYNKICN